MPSGVCPDGRARGLAWKLYQGHLKPLYVPDQLTQDYRCLIRARVSTTRRITSLVNELGAVLRSWGVVVGVSLLTEKGGRLMEAARERLPEYSQMVFDGLRTQLTCAREQEAIFTEQIEKLAASDEVCQLLMSIPGVGPMTAFGVRAEVGDINRFPSAKHLISYCGLAPVVAQSAETYRTGHLPVACNKVLRYLLVLRGSAIAMGRKDTPLRRAYYRAALRGHVNDGKINAARKLTRIIYGMMRYQEPWCAEKAAARG
jgi:transposase